MYLHVSICAQIWYNTSMKHQKKLAIAAERSSAYGRSFIRGVAEVAEKHPEWDLVLIDPHSIASKSAETFDGWICRVADMRTAHALMRSGQPVVDCLCPQPITQFASIMTDAEQIGQLAAEHLLRRRFTNFAFCGYRRVAFSDRRRNTFASFLEQKKIRPSIYRPPFRKENCFGRDFLLGDRVDSPPDAADLAQWLLRLPKPVGIFCCDDLRASNVLSICRSLNISVPDDVAILGVDDDPIYCMFSTPRLSSIDPDAFTIGKTAAATMAKMLENGSIAANPPKLIVPPKGIVERASTNTYPHAPPWFAEALAFIQANVSHGISASDVFRHVGFSRTLVERAFRKCISSSVQGRIAESRIEEAKRLLESTSLQIKEIATLSGFSSLEYLSRAFTCATGLSPSAWRAKNA